LIFLEHDLQMSEGRNREMERTSKERIRQLKKDLNEERRRREEESGKAKRTQDSLNDTTNQVLSIFYLESLILDELIVKK